MDRSKLALWDNFCRAQAVLEEATPLFHSAEGIVRLRSYGRDGRLLLERAPDMDAVVIREAERVIADHERGAGEYEGLIYMMFWTEGERVLPLYIGKTEKFGRGGGNLSANIATIRTDAGKFARWGYNYAYHIGDLSAAVCPGHPPAKINMKYRRWADRLFCDVPSATPALNRQTLFWTRAWARGDTGIWSDWGATSLTFLEYLLIGVASDLFPGYLLNVEGVNRG